METKIRVSAFDPSAPFTIGRELGQRSQGFEKFPPYALKTMGMRYLDCGVNGKDEKGDSQRLIPTSRDSFGPRANWRD